MPLTKQGEWRPSQGTDVNTPELLVAPTRAAYSENILFERGIALSRPGLETHTVAVAVTDTGWKHVRAYCQPSADYKFVAIIGDTIYKLEPVLVFTDPADLSKFTVNFTATNMGTFSASGGFSTASTMSDLVNQVILITGNGAGLIQWDPAGIVPAVIAASPTWQFICGHLSRAIGACTSDTGNGSITVGWSVTGDVTDWAGLGSGTALLVDSVGRLTGVGVIRNQVVVCRTDGFNLGTLSGDATAAYGFQTYSRNDVGFWLPKSIAWARDYVFGIGANDIYKFDTVDVIGIGQDIAPLLFKYQQLGADYEGFICDGMYNRKLRYYHLVPRNASFLPEIPPHFAYNIDEGTWSIHTYLKQPLGGFAMQLLSYSSPAILTANSDINIWNPNVDCEIDGILRQGRTIFGADASVNVQLTRTLMSYNNKSLTEAVPQLALDAVVGRDEPASGPGDSGVPSNDSVTADAHLIPAPSWRRAWFDTILSGNDFQAEIVIPAPHSLEIGTIGFYGEAAGEFQ